MEIWRDYRNWNNIEKENLFGGIILHNTKTYFSSVETKKYEIGEGTDTEIIWIK